MLKYLAELLLEPDLEYVGSQRHRDFHVCAFAAMPALTHAVLAPAGLIVPPILKVSKGLKLLLTDKKN